VHFINKLSASLGCTLCPSNLQLSPIGKMHPIDGLLINCPLVALSRCLSDSDSHSNLHFQLIMLFMLYNILMCLVRSTHVFVAAAVKTGNANANRKIKLKIKKIMDMLSGAKVKA